jgi:hypothetical protein
VADDCGGIGIGAAGPTPDRIGRDLEGSGGRVELALESGDAAQ